MSALKTRSLSGGSFRGPAVGFHLDEEIKIAFVFSVSARLATEKYDAAWIEMLDDALGDGLQIDRRPVQRSAV